jgi:hypothetical protein
MAAVVVGLIAAQAMLTSSVAGASAPGAPSGDGYQPEVVTGNQTCASLIDAEGELKVEPVASGTYTQDGLSVTVTVNPGATFDFTATGGQVLAVFVKGGPDGNLYDYRVPDPPGFNNSDTGLHSPINPRNGNFYGLSHISFCYDPTPPTDLDVTKVAASAEITIGDKFEYAITIDEFADGIDAINAVLNDPLIPAHYVWEIVSQDGTACEITGGNQLSCAFATLADGSSYTVTVRTTTAAPADDCDTSWTNIATATADNVVGPRTGQDTIEVHCGGVKVVKNAKHADSASSPNLAATFKIVDALGGEHEVTTDAVTGTACVGGLPTGSAAVTETSGPAGYALDTDEETVTVTNADCGDAEVAFASFENVPLTDISWSVDSQVDGGTLTSVTCWITQDGVTSIAPGYPTTVGDGSGSLDGLLPTDPDVTVRCDFTVDP